MSRVDEAKWTERLRALGLRGRLPEQLTEAVLEAVRTRPQGERFLLADGQVPGLSLMVGATGHATFWLQYRNAAGQRRMHKVAAAGAVPLRDARALARKLLVDVAGGRDPAAEKRSARDESAKGKTVRRYLEDVYEPKKLKLRKGRNGAIAKAHILSSWEPLLDVQLGELTRDAIEKVLADRKAATRKDGSRKTKDGPSSHFIGLSLAERGGSGLHSAAQSGHQRREASVLVTAMAIVGSVVRLLDDQSPPAAVG